MDIDREELLMKLGAARSYARAAWRLIDIEVDPKAAKFAYSLNLTDLHSGWCETRAVLGRGQEAVLAALGELRSRLPFPLRGIHSDNGSEFINHHLVRYCRSQGIQFTRSRPYKKDDNARIEQKNWTHVRRIWGWERYDTLPQVRAMNDLYTAELRLMMNLFQPSVKLVEKVRRGSRLSRQYDPPRTPWTASPTLSPGTRCLQPSRSSWPCAKP